MPSIAEPARPPTRRQRPAVRVDRKRSETTAPPVDGRRTDTRARILEAALALFGTHGYTGTTTADIERAVGLRPGGGGLYRHFRAKEDLLEAVVGQYHERVVALRDRLADERTASPPATGIDVLADELRHVVGELGRFLAAESAIVRLNNEVAALPESVRLRIGAAWEDGYGILADLFVHHNVAADHSRLVSVHALGAIDHYVANATTWNTLPADIPPGVFIEHWIETWSRVAYHRRPET